MSVEQLPQRIREHIISRADEEQQWQGSCIAVAELTDCIRKAWYRRTTPKEPTADRMFACYRGHIFHDLWAPLFPCHDLRVTHRVPDLEEPCIISGRIDLAEGDTLYLLQSGADREIETLLETGRTGHHIQEAMACAWMGGFRAAFLIYGSWAGVRLFEVPLDGADALMKALEVRARAVYRALASGQPPTPAGRWGWSCSRCEYSGVCEERIRLTREAGDRTQERRFSAACAK